MTHALYIDRHGTKVGFRGGRLHLDLRDAEPVDVPIHQVRFVVVCGHAHFSHEALRALLLNQIPTVISSRHGGFLGSLGGPQGNQVLRRMAQYDALRDPSRALVVGRALVGAKLRSQARLLHQWGMPASPLIRDALRALAACAGMDALRGHEGIAARAYFQGLRVHLRKSPFDFPGRRHHPPPDPVNAALSLGYALLTAEMEVGAAGAGLDRCAGFLHRPEASRASLLLDLVEPMRPLVDRLAARLLCHALEPADFQMNGESCRLVDGRRGLYYRAWEDFLDTPVSWRGQLASWRRVIHLQAMVLAEYLDGKVDCPEFWYLDDAG